VLTLYETTQHIFGTKELVSIVLGIPQRKSMLCVSFWVAALAAKLRLAAYVAGGTCREAPEPTVRIQLTRAQLYSMVGHQPASVQTIALGADKDGKLTASATRAFRPRLYSTTTLSMRRFAPFAVGASGASGQTIRSSTYTATPDRTTRTSRALGHFALESAMDELAYATGVDPVALRLLNDTEVDPLTGRPFHARHAQVSEGGRRGSAGKATPSPLHARRRYLIGQGMAVACTRTGAGRRRRGSR